MVEAAYSLDGPRRALTMRAVGEVCGESGCRLIAAHLRTTHAHVLVMADGDDLRPEGLTNGFKRRAGRLLTGVGFDEGRRKRWARHGSYQRVQSLERAVKYVVKRQGGPMGMYLDPEW
jgi:REP element-mobilizing transposase RayT